MYGCCGDFGRFQAALDALPPNAQPESVLYEIEGQAKDVLAAGLSFNFERFDISLPQGDVNAVMNVDISESDRDDFEWANLLLALNANAKTYKLVRRSS